MNEDESADFSLHRVCVRMHIYSEQTGISHDDTNYLRRLSRFVFIQAVSWEPSRGTDRDCRYRGIDGWTASLEQGAVSPSQFTIFSHLSDSAEVLEASHSRTLIWQWPRGKQRQGETEEMTDRCRPTLRETTGERWRNEEVTVEQVCTCLFEEQKILFCCPLLILISFQTKFDFLLWKTKYLFICLDQLSMQWKRMGVPTNCHCMDQNIQVGKGFSSIYKIALFQSYLAASCLGTLTEVDNPGSLEICACGNWVASCKFCDNFKVFPVSGTKSAFSFILNRWTWIWDFIIMLVVVCIVVDFK